MTEIKMGNAVCVFKDTDIACPSVPPEFASVFSWCLNCSLCKCFLFYMYNICHVFLRMRLLCLSTGSSLSGPSDSFCSLFTLCEYSKDMFGFPCYLLCSCRLNFGFMKCWCAVVRLFLLSYFFPRTYLFFKFGFSLALFGVFYIHLTIYYRRQLYCRTNLIPS